jgi:4'-phosphopantetheinyl transferase
MESSAPPVVYWTFCETKNLNEEHNQNHLEKLSYTERMRYDEIQDPQRSKQFLLGRILIWHLLKEAFDITDYTIETQDTYDKPKLVFSQSELELDFNISHTEELVVAVISAAGNVGIDIEDMQTNRNWHALGKKYFSAHENQDIERKPAHIKPELSLKLWITKEAAIKAQGQTISRGMADIKTIHRWSEKKMYEAKGTHQNTEWQVFGITPLEHHYGSIALVKDEAKSEAPELKLLPYRPSA